MPIMLKHRRRVCILIVATSVTLLPMMGFAKTKPIMTTDLLQHLKKGEPWDRGVLTATKMVMFQQDASGGTDASSVSKITLAYFTSSNCTGAKAGSGFYTTPNGTSFTISVGTPFGLVAASAWNVGSTQLSITNMTSIRSIAVTLKSTNNNTPQANFSGKSFACIPVICTAGPSGQCTSGSGPQSFMLKTTAAVGDPADGGVIGCQNTGSSFNLFDIVVTTSDQSTAQGWGGSGTITGATSPTNGAQNTATIVTILGTTITYAARTCNELSVTGGYSSGWFLPSGANNATSVNQVNCLYNNKNAIAAGSVAAGGAGFASTQYWSSTETNSTNAWFQNFNNGLRGGASKSSNYRVRCSRTF